MKLDDSKFYYGLQARPFSADFALSNTDWEIINNNADDMNSLANQIGQHCVRHGVMVTKSPLDNDFIQAHELVDIRVAMKADVDKVLKTIDYLVAKRSKDKYLSNAFFNQIGMSSDEFDGLLLKYDTNAEELWEDRVWGVQS